MTAIQEKMQALISKKELERAFDARFPREMKEKFSNARVAVAGLGGLGSNIAVMLARSGIGHLLLVDFDTVDVTNLNRQMYMILHRFANGLATEKDFERMERLSFTMATASSCGLGQSACTALDSCLKHRREEFQAHIKGICPVCLNSRKYGDQYAY